jgi:hypothetical protein
MKTTALLLALIGMAFLAPLYAEDPTAKTATKDAPFVNSPGITEAGSGLEFRFC